MSKAQKNEKAVCPTCGACPTCGKDRPVYPVFHYVPDPYFVPQPLQYLPPTYPWWYGGTTSIGYCGTASTDMRGEASTAGSRLVTWVTNNG